LPTDQIVFANDGGGAAHVGFGGMSFEVIEGGQLVFLRVRDLQPEALLSPPPAGSKDDARATDGRVRCG